MLFHIDNWFVQKCNCGNLGYNPTDAYTDLGLLQQEEVLLVNWIDILIKQEFNMDLDLNSPSEPITPAEAFAEAFRWSVTG
ncbi:uncharacterized protein ACA1_066310 [Acanthamoeba castellanii str. Neff]|uniref:Uncharacterized protein n=1 Tax=Acanthamoeba castellanii (strain ATCC 30010 / Neff) TaxID=1257118 RepID=L8GX11_ACACF|nr:uncharacterized protein ACA1_066310 [Acanthamoeba castellanii str. Neff]ELR17809.1 hypothetical protein ACA1_066310 [Acanthamoeba castellanii str. Neff]